MPDGSNPERVERLITAINDLHVALDEDRQQLAELVGAVEKLQDDRKRDRRWAMFAAVVVAALVALAFWNYRIAEDRQAGQQRDDIRLCQRSVSVRDDNRAMWEWLIDAVADRSELAPEARRQLDTLLPSLRCDDENHPVPVAD